MPPCAVQPDGREVCEQDPGKPSPCPQVVAPADEPLEPPHSVDCDGPVPDPAELPAAIEVLLVDAEPALVLLGAVDGSRDGYLVPAYRFTDADGGTVDLPAVADAALTTSPPTTDPRREEPEPPEPPADPCGTPLVEEDPRGTTLTVQPDTGCAVPEPQPEPAPLADGEEPAVGVGYYVDVDTTCEAFELGGTVWILDEGDVSDWADPGERHEGGTFTLDAADHGTFVGDHQGMLTATFRRPAVNEDRGTCTPLPRP
jgi:hypothetical protein